MHLLYGAPSCANVQGIDVHDAGYFRLNKSEAVTLDPQTRVLLEVRKSLQFVIHFDIFCVLRMASDMSHLYACVALLISARSRCWLHALCKHHRT